MVAAGVGPERVLDLHSLAGEQRLRRSASLESPSHRSVYDPLVSELHQISAVALVCSDDHWPGADAAGSLGSRTGVHWTHFRHLWTGTVVLLSPPCAVAPCP